MKFLLQDSRDERGGFQEHDFVQRVSDLSKYYEMKGDPYKTITSAKYLLNFFDPKLFHADMASYIPVGDVEFVQLYLKAVGGPETIPPFNVPECLMPHAYSGRKMENIRCFNDAVRFLEKTSHLVYKKRFYAKSLDTIKHMDNGFFEVVNDDIKEDDGYFTGVRKLSAVNACTHMVGKQVSTMLNDIRSEWRVFIYEEKVAGCEMYLGDPLAFPNAESIQAMVTVLQMHRAASEKNGKPFEYPKTYSFDVAVVGANCNTYIIEMHDFFSLGLYGFTDEKYPYMLSHAWFSILNRYGVCNSSIKF